MLARCCVSLVMLSVLGACGGMSVPASPSAPGPAGEAAPVMVTAVPSDLPSGITAPAGPEIVTVPEMAFLPIEVQQGPDGATVSIQGLYHIFDTSNRQIDVCRAQGAQSACRRYPLDRELAAQPLAVSVQGIWRNGRVTVTEWQALPFAWAEGVATCSRALEAQAERLGQIDWSVPALPAYRESSAHFKLDAAALAAFTLAPAGFDPDQGQFILRGQGPLLPERNPLVKRWALLYCIGNVGDLGVTHIVATIEGFVAEH